MDDAFSGDSESERLQSLSSISSPHSSPSGRPAVERWSLTSASSGYESPAAYWTTPEENDLLTVSRYSDHDVSDRSSRSRSTSPYSTTPRGYNLDMVTLQELFRERYPKAIEQMESRLKSFQRELGLQECASHRDAAINFVAVQLSSVVKDLLEKSESDTVTMQVFQSISDKLRQLNEDNIRRGATAETLSVVQKLLHQMAVIIARPRGLLECMEHDVDKLDVQRKTQSLPGRSSQSLEDMESPPATLGCSSHLVEYVRQCLTPKDLSPGNRRLSAAKSEEDEVMPQDVQPKADDFERIKLISSGAYGSVYLVRHKERRQRFAMKKVAKSNVMRKKNLDQVYAERNILTFANNPFVVGLWCTFETKKHFCMVLEYVEGGDCAALLKAIGGPLPTDLARLYVAETVLALEYLHSYGIVHRDLKPDNMLITSVGHIKLTDFGLSKVGLMSYASSIYEEGMTNNQVFVDDQVFGTPDYIAPEVILRQGYSAPVDWWALGVVLYQFLVGVTPFVGTSVEELFEQITDDTILPEFPDDVPFSEDAQDIIERLLVRDPNERLGSSSFSGIADVKHHKFFADVDWRNLLLQKAEFMPQLENEEDTSYFDPRTDRYDHTLADEEDDTAGDEDCLYSSFMSMSPSFSRVITPALSRSTSINKSDSDLSDFSSLETNSLPSSPFHAWRSHEVETSSQHGSLTSTSTDPTSASSTPDRDHMVFGTTRTLSTGSHPPPEAIVVVPPPAPTTAPSLVTTAAATTTGPTSLGSLAAFNRHSGLDRPIRLSRRRQSLDETCARVRSRLLNLAPRLSDSSHYTSLASTAPASPSHSSLATSGTTVAALTSPVSSRSSLSGLHAPTRQQNSLAAGSTVVLQPKATVGMTLKAIRVFLGTTDNFVVQHLIKSVLEGSASWNAGVRPDHLITHIDGVPVVGLKHTDVVQLLNSNRKCTTTLQVVALSSTSISNKCRRRQSANAKRLTSRHEKKLSRTSSNSARVKRRLSLLIPWRSRKNSRAADSPDHPVALTCPASPIVCAKATLSLSQRLGRIMPHRRPSITSLTPMSPLATVSQTSPQRQPSNTHTALRRTASVGSPLSAYARPSSRAPKQEQFLSVACAEKDTSDVVGASLRPEAVSEPHTPQRRKLRRSDVLSASDALRKTSE